MSLFLSLLILPISLLMLRVFIIRLVVLKPFQAAVVTRFGSVSVIDRRALFWSFPLIDTVEIFSLALSVYDVPAFRLVTRENLTILVDLIVHYYVTDGKRFTMASSNSLEILKHTLCDLLGTKSRNFSTEDVRIRLPEVIEQTLEDLNKEMGRLGIKISALKMEKIAFPASLDKAAQSIVEEEARSKLAKSKLEYERQEALLRAELQKQLKKTQLELEAMEHEAQQRKLLQEAQTRSQIESTRNQALIDSLQSMVEKMKDKMPPETALTLLSGYMSSRQQQEALASLNSKATVAYIPSSALIATNSLHPGAAS